MRSAGSGWSASRTTSPAAATAPRVANRHVRRACMRPSLQPCPRMISRHFRLRDAGHVVVKAASTRCERGHATCVRGLPPPSRSIYLSRLTIPLLGAAPAPGRLRPKGGGMARRYETVYIFDPALEEPAITERLERFNALLTKDAKGSITNVAHWGKSTLSYTIQKKDTAYYVVAQFETAAELLPEYERAVKLEEGVVRFLVVVSEGLPAKPEPPPAVIAADVVVDEIEEDEA